MQPSPWQRPKRSSIARYPDELVTEAFAELVLPGRFEVVGHHPLVVLDGAHNPDALAQLARTVEAEFQPIGSRIVVMGQLAGRDPDSALAAIADAP